MKYKVVYRSMTARYETVINANTDIEAKDKFMKSAFIQQEAPLITVTAIHDEDS